MTCQVIQYAYICTLSPHPNIACVVIHIYLVFQMLPSTISNILVFAIVISDIFLVIVYNVYTREHADSKQMGYMMTLIHDTSEMIGMKRETHV